MLNAVSSCVAETAAELDQLGFRSTLIGYHRELILPFSRLGDEDAGASPLQVLRAGCCAPLLNTLPCANIGRPSSDRVRKASFVLWNVACFWLGVIDLVLIAVLKEKHIEASFWTSCIALVDGLAGYFFACLFYFLFVSSVNTRFQGWGLWILLLYAGGTAYLTYEALEHPEDHVEIAEGVLNALKCVANLAAFSWALRIWIAARGEEVRSKVAPLN